MAFIQFHFFSEALGMQSEAYVIIPQRSTRGQIGITSNGNKEKYKCLYLLHGLSDDHTIWMRRTSIERYAEEHGIAVVMPCGHRSFYTNMSCGLNYYDYVARELPALICEFFNISDKREDNFVAGLSMGGYGALKIALREPERFSAAIALSPVTDIHIEGRWNLAESLFGVGKDFPDNEDLFYLADKCAKNPCRPRLYTVIGTEDFLYEENVRFCDKLNVLEYDHTHIEAPGDHNWGFWDEHIQSALEWLLDGNN